MMMNNITAVNDKFNRTPANMSKYTIIANNKIDVSFDRFENLRGTAIESLIKTFSAIMIEADRHEETGDNFFDYTEDRARASAHIDILIKLIYEYGGDIEKIENDYTCERSKIVSLELSDHYWAFCK